MRVLVVPSWYTPGPNKQLGAFFREQAKAILESGLDVIVADATLQGRNNYFSKNNFRLNHFDDEGLDTYTFTSPAFGMSAFTQICKKVFYCNMNKIFQQILKDGKKIDLIHAHSFYPAGYAAVKLGEKYNIPVVVTEHSSGIISKKITSAHVSLLKKCVEGSSEFICVSNALKQGIIDYTNSSKELHVIPNMVDERFTYQDTESNGNDFCYVSIGNLIHSKRFDLTIKSFAMCFKDKSNVKLKIIGDGGLSSELKKMVDKLGITSQVIFTGKLSRDDVVKELQKSHAFVLPSDFETFGVVYIEAMACGLPVIGTRNGGADDIITPSAGYLVNVNNLDDLASAMKDCYNSYQKFDKKQISETCRKQFGEKSVVKQINALYEKVVR